MFISAFLFESQSSFVFQSGSVMKVDVWRLSLLLELKAGGVS